MPNAQTVQTVANSRARRLETARVHQRWVSTASLVNQQVLALHKLSLAVHDATDRAFLTECVASVEDVNDAIHELHVAAIDPRARSWLAPESPLSSYVSAAYSWCANVLASLAEVAALGEGALREAGEQVLARRSSEYVKSTLEPLFQRLAQVWQPSLAEDRTLRWIYDRAEHVESEIACLDWELQTDADGEYSDRSDQPA